MKRLIKFGLFGFVIAGAIASGDQAIAQLPSVFKVQNPTSGVESVVVTGTPRTQIPVSFTGGTVTKRIPIRTNACGFGVLRNASQYASNQISAGSYNFTAQAILAESTANGIPTCNTSGGAPTPSFPLPDTLGSTKLAHKAVDGSIIIQGVGVNQVVDLILQAPQSSSRFVSTNACGYGSASIPSGADNVSVNNAAPTTISSLPIYTVSCSSGALYGAGGSISSTLPEIFKDASNNVYVAAVPSTPVVINLPGTANIRSVTSDRCGGLTLGSASNPISGTIKVNDISVDTDLLSTGLKPRCLLTGGVYEFEAAPSNVKLANGQVFLVTVPGLNLNGALRANGFADRSIVSVESQGNRTIRATANACGVATLRATSFGNNPDTVVSVTPLSGNSTSQSVSSFPLASPNRCVSGNSLVRLN